MRRPLALACAVALLLASGSTAASAQAVLGLGDDALVLPRGVMRVRLVNQWTRFSERYGENTPGRMKGALEPLGVDLTLDTIGLVQFPSLTSVQAGLRSLSGVNEFNLSLGRTIVNSSVKVTATPIVLEAGISNRFSVGVSVPIITTRNNIGFDANPAGREGNVGFNPALGSAQAVAVNAAFKNQFDLAASALQANLDQCATPPASASPQCMGLNARRTTALSLISNSRAFAGGLAQLYGTAAGQGSPFVPIAGTDVQLAIEARTAGFRNAFSAFLGAGNPIAAITTGPVASQARVTVADAQNILTNPAFGIEAAPLQTFEQRKLGDIDLGVKYLLIDPSTGDPDARFDYKGFKFRSAVGGGLRLGSGTADNPDNFGDVATGTGANALSLRSFNDFIFGKHLWAYVGARYTWQLSDDQFVRITDEPERALANLYRRRKVGRNLGDFLEIEASPRVVLNDYFAVGGQYYYRVKSADSYSGTFAVDAATTRFADITLNANTLSKETRQTEHRMGGSVAFSTVQAFNRGKFKLPLEVTYTHFQTTKANGGNVPKQFSDQVQLRLYGRIFGGPSTEPTQNTQSPR